MVANVEGQLIIHGETNLINVVGNLFVDENATYITDVRFVDKIKRL